MYRVHKQHFAYLFPLCLLLALAISSPLYPKVLIFTYAYNRPDFILLQHQTFERFLQNDYEFIVFNDATQEKEYQDIKEICESLNITCIDIPQEIHTRPYLHRPECGRFMPYQQASVRNSNVVQYSLDTYGFNHDDILMLIDSDMFLIKEFNVKSFMQGYDLAGFHKSCCNDTKRIQHTNEIPHIYYLWIGLIIIDMRSLRCKIALNVNCGFHEDIQLDAGGFSTLFLQNNRDASTRSIERICMHELMCEKCLLKKESSCSHTKPLLLEYGFSKETITFIQNVPVLYDKNRFRNAEFFFDNTFVHYRAGSNYNKISEDFSIRKTKAFNTLINDLLY